MIDNSSVILESDNVQDDRSADVIVQSGPRMSIKPMGGHNKPNAT
jgi:hypothetical protein